MNVDQSNQGRDPREPKSIPPFSREPSDILHQASAFELQSFEYKLSRFSTELNFSKEATTRALEAFNDNHQIRDLFKKQFEETVKRSLDAVTRLMPLSFAYTVATVSTASNVAIAIAAPPNVLMVAALSFNVAMWAMLYRLTDRRIQLSTPSLIAESIRSSTKQHYKEQFETVKTTLRGLSSEVAESSHGRVYISTDSRENTRESNLKFHVNVQMLKVQHSGIAAMIKDPLERAVFDKVSAVVSPLLDLAVIYSGLRRELFEKNEPVYKHHELNEAGNALARLINNVVSKMPIYNFKLPDVECVKDSNYIIPSFIGIIRGEHTQRR